MQLVPAGEMRLAVDFRRLRFPQRNDGVDLPEIMAALTAGVAEIRAAEASAIPDDAAAASKNAPGPAAS